MILHLLTCFRSAVSRPVAYLLPMRAIVVDVCGPKLQLPWILLLLRLESVAGRQQFDSGLLIFNLQDRFLLLLLLLRLLLLREPYLPDYLKHLYLHMTYGCFRTIKAAVITSITPVRPVTGLRNHLNHAVKRGTLICRGFLILHGLFGSCLRIWIQIAGPSVNLSAHIILRWLLRPWVIKRTYVLTSRVESIAFKFIASFFTTKGP